MRSKGDTTRQGIIDAARTLFYRRGYFHTSFSDIVEQAAVWRGNIYHYFRTKEDILGAVIEQQLADYRNQFLEWERQHPQPRERLLCFVEMVAGNRENLMRYGCPIGTLNAELGKDTPHLRKAAKALFDLFTDWLAAQFMALGKRRKEAQTLALHLLGRAEGISVITHVYADPKLLLAEIAQLRAWINEL